MSSHRQCRHHATPRCSTIVTVEQASWVVSIKKRLMQHEKPSHGLLNCMESSITKIANLVLQEIG
jgi:hypothetical protein